MGNGQIGFVPGAGTDLHVYKLLKRIKQKQELCKGRGKKSNKYVALFIDFKNAYNSPPHQVVLQTVQEIEELDENTKQWIKWLYA